MTVYLGKKPVGVTKIVKKEIPESRFGVKISDLLGTVDADGNYIPPTEDYVLDLTGVKSIPSYAFLAFGAADTNSLSPSGRTRRFRGIIANDVVSIGSFAFYGVAFYDESFEFASFDSVEELSSTGVFTSAFSYAKNASFASLKRITGSGAFVSAFDAVTDLEYDKIFPVLTYVIGSSSLKMGETTSSNYGVVRLSKIQTLVGSSSQYSSIFGSTYVTIFVPRCTQIQQYVCRPSHKNILHFAAANQAAIEACDGYSSMFGATAIYFDLMLTITVNGVVYDREYTIGGYTSWKDTNGNLVYTDATTEPAVGTVVYSDNGTTQVGTVEGVA